MSEEKTKRLTKLLEELKTEYLARFPQRLRHLHRCLIEADWVELEREFHKIKGNGKTYGFPAISQVADVAETALGRKHFDGKFYEKTIAILEVLMMNYLNGIEFRLEKIDMYHELKQILKKKAAND